MRFLNREEAGVHLGYALAGHGAPDAVVLSLPRGGVVVGYYVARALGAPLEILVCQRVTVPGRLGLAVGAVAEGGASYLDVGRARAMSISPEELRHALRSARLEVERRVARYRGGRPLPDLRGRAVILVDDAIASGATVRVAVDAIRDWMSREVVVAAPVAARSVAEALRLRADSVVYLHAPSVLHTPGEWYEDFAPLNDADVVRWLERARHDHQGSAVSA
jgi:putative phosphoribosyl transferase